MEITRRQVGIAMLVIQTLASLLLLIGQLQLGQNMDTVVALIFALIASAVLLIAYQRGWDLAGTVDVVLITLLTGIGTPEPFVTKASALIVLVPTSIALILARPAWIIGSMVGVLAIYSLRGGPANYFVNAYIGDLRTLGTVIFLVGCMFLSRLVAETAQRAAEAAAERADLARAEAEQKAGLLVQQAEDLAVRNEEQSRLLALVDTLEVAAVALDDGILLAPLIGRVDQRRLDILTERLLKQATLQRTLLVILDVAGVPSISATVAVALGRLAQALQLVGCTVMITGLTSTVAQTLTAEGVGFPGVATIRAPQEALALWRARGVAVPPA